MKATELFASQVVKAERHKVFDAWTKPELVRQVVGTATFHLPTCRRCKSPSSPTIWSLRKRVGTVGANLPRR